MDEEKKQQTPQDENADGTDSGFSSDDSVQGEDGLPVVKNQPEPAEEKHRQKRDKKQKKREARRQKYPSRLSFLLGFVILVLAVIGVVLMVWNGVRYIRSTTQTESEFAQYNAYLTPIAAVDPDPFDAVTDAQQEQLLGCAVWSILSADSTPDTYAYESGYMLIPDADVESAYVALFGSETVSSLTHGAIQSYNCTFEYDSTAKMYKIPITAILPVYTPQVTSVSKDGTALVVTVNYLASESWAQDAEGNYIPPAADKVMRITLRELQGSYFISAIQTLSSTVPETVSFEWTTAAEETATEELSESSAQSETTTIPVVPEKTTLGGRI